MKVSKVEKVKEVDQGLYPCPPQAEAESSSFAISSKDPSYITGGCGIFLEKRGRI